jgi:hypothetical protein
LDCPSLLEDTADRRLSYVGTFADCVISLFLGASLKVGTVGRAGPGSRVSIGGGNFVVTKGISGATGSSNLTFGASTGG